MKMVLLTILYGNSFYFFWRIIFVQKDFLMNVLIFIVSVGFALIANILIEKKEEKI